MSNTVQSRRRTNGAEAGSAFIELGLFFPVLLLLLLGAIDFARVYYASVTLINAAEVGAQYGSKSVSSSSDTSGMATAATNDASDLTAVTATASQSCTCSGTSKACIGTCTVTKRIWVTVNTSYTFSPLFPYPGIPSSIAMTRTATMRAK